jgi:mRNA-degrading endonuclease toxin of MazEF toxin-antitoxin module
MKYKQRKIVLVLFPYSDLSSAKSDLFLIVSNNTYNSTYNDVLVCVITSKYNKDSYSVDITNDDLEIGILPEKSTIQTHKLFSIDQKMILRRFSVVTQDFYRKVYLSIDRLIDSKE